MKTLQSVFALVALALVAVVLPDTIAQTPAPKDEAQLLAILRSDASKGEKAIACKNLSIYGSTAAVAELAKLLGDEQLCSWARIPLEVIPGPAADEALRKATESLQGLQLVGVINSIGVRRDTGSVELLSKRLEDKDANVASAAAVALGKIGNAAAAKSLRQALTSVPAGVRSAVAEGCVLCAEHFLADGNRGEATAIYDEVRKADVPRQRMIEATRGAILARGKEGLPILLELLRSNDKGLFQVGLSTARELSAREVDQALAAELERAFPERAALIISVMADRKESVDLAAVMKAAGRGQTQVRLAAVNALGRIGNITCLAPLLDIAAESDAELSAAAKEALVSLPGESVDQEIVTRLDKADAKTYPLLIELIGQRRIDALPAVLKAVNHSDRAVRTAALTALGNTAPQKYLSVLITQVVTPKDSETAPVAQQALKAAAVRMPDREACAGELSAALDRAPAATKTVLLEILGSVGGTKALAAVNAAAKSADPGLQDVGSRVLGEWGSVDAAPVLLALAKSGGKYQTRALRGYIGMATKFNMPDDQRAEMCRSALEASRQAAEQKQVFDVLKRYPNLPMLKLAVNAMQVPELKDDATAAARAIAEKITKTDEVKALLVKAGLDK
jgi:HEAT repeat protein